jgi:hypothetical protein
MQAEALDAALDPGRGWRRLGRGCACLGIGLIFAPVGPGELFIQMVPLYLRWALAVEQRHLTRVENFFATFFYCYTPALLLAGLLLCAVFSPRLVHGASRIPRAAAWLLWLLILFPPYFIAVYHVGNFDNEETQGLLYGMLSIYLFVGALSYLAARRRGGSAQFVLRLLAVPMPFLLLATLAGVALSIHDFIYLGGSGWLLYGLVLSSVAFILGVLITLAWIFWWRAVAKYEGEKQAAESVVPQSVQKP